MAYDGMVLNEERANELFASSGRTSDAVLQQAVPTLAAAGVIIRYIVHLGVPIFWVHLKSSYIWIRTPVPGVRTFF